MDDGEAAKTVAGRVSAFYERHPYPPPRDDLEAYGRLWDDRRRRADACLFWPHEPYRDDRSILVAGCGTSQAARYAVRWPRAQVTGIEISAGSVSFTEELKRRHRLDNLEVRRLPIERAAELGRSFDHVVCTGVAHHLPDPDEGLRALREVLAPDGAMHLMVYAPFGRAGVYLLQDYCRRLGIVATDTDIADLIASLQALPADHPLVPLLRGAQDFRTDAGIADALLHPQDRAYSVPQLFELLGRAGLHFGRWIRQAPYLPGCGALASSPHRQRLDRLEAEDQYAAVELFRGTMVRHALTAFRGDHPANARAVTFEGDAWLDYVPIRTPGALSMVERERLPQGAAAVLINTGHKSNDIYLPVTPAQATLLAAVDGARSIAKIAGPPGHRAAARDFFHLLWRYDQVLFDTSPSGRPTPTSAAQLLQPLQER